MHMMYSRVLALGVCSLSLLAAADVTLVEEIVSKVNGDIVTRSELERGQRMLEAELRQQKGLTAGASNEQVVQRQKDGLRDRIDQLLLVQKGKELNINVDSDIS